MSAEQPNSKPNKNTWPIGFSAIQSPPLWIANALTTIGILLAVFILLLAAVSIIRLAFDLLGDNGQRASDAVKSFLPIAAAVIGLPLIVWRLVILNQQTRISEAKTQIDRETHYTSIFSKSVEQLGETREIKEANSSGTGDIITLTAPNVEVRLGGIHSLSRLAEESIRDQEKIENVLLSYVRENSWVDRKGAWSNRPLLAKPGAWSWQYELMGGKVTDKEADKSKLEYEKWAKATEDRYTKLLGWAKNAVETRVDVNEAVDAVSVIPTSRNENDRRRFYECLFVGRKFSSRHLQLAEFDRCTFIRCEFMSSDQSFIKLRDSQIFECKFIGPDTRLRMYGCDIAGSSFSKISGSDLRLVACYGQSNSFHEIDNTAIDLSHAELRKCWFSGLDKVYRSGMTLKGEYAALGECSFFKLKFPAKSSFEKSAFSKCNLYSADLTELGNFTVPWLGDTEADAGTATSPELIRPSSWPPFDPDFVDVLF